MFIQNKYTVWYYNIIKKAKTRTLTTYKEKHHIVPKSLGGSNSKNNIAELTLREHFVCHLLLPKMLTGKNRRKMLHAAWRLAHVCGQKIKSRQYENLKKQRSIAMTGVKNPGVSKALSGTKRPAKAIAKQIKTTTGVAKPATSIALKGRKNPKVSKALKGRAQPKELVEKRAATLKAMYKAGEFTGTKGRTQSAEERLKRSKIMKGKPSPKKGIPWSASRREAYEQSKKNK